MTAPIAIPIVLLDPDSALGVVTLGVEGVGPSVGKKDFKTLLWTENLTN